jgi:hypothetical protein
LGYLAVAAVAFLVTVKVLDDWGPSEDPNPTLLQPPAFDAASLPRLAPGQTLDFSNGQNKDALLAGWSSSEPAAVWTEGHSAFVGFVLRAGGAPARQMTLRAMPFVMPGKLASQHVQVWHQNTRLVAFDMSVLDATLTIPLTEVPMADGEVIILCLYLPDAIAPAALQPGLDPRVHGLYVKSLQLVPSS